MKKTFRLLLKIILTLLGILLLALVILKLIYNEDIPQGKTGNPADALAYKMLDALNHQQFQDAKEIRWQFRGINRYEWKVQQDLVDVYWNDYHVSLQAKTPNQSLAYLNNKILKDEQREEAIAYALQNFNNDSFWLIAPYKVFDKGSERQLIEEDGEQKLLVTYTTGGSTPGDSYLWELDDNYRPVSMKMWVSIIPLDGLEAHWTDWQMTSGGFLLAQKRSVYGVEIPITEIVVLP